MFRRLLADFDLDASQVVETQVVESKVVETQGGGETTLVETKVIETQVVATDNEELGMTLTQQGFVLILLTLGTVGW